MTPSANLDLVRSIYSAWERGDFSSAEWAHPEIEFVIADGPVPGRWLGQAGMAQGFRHFVNAWQEYRVEVDEYRELDGGRILVFICLSGRGKTSGLELDQIQPKAANLLHVGGDLVTKFVIYFDRDHALADLGISPDMDS